MTENTQPAIFTVSVPPSGSSGRNRVRPPARRATPSGNSHALVAAGALPWGRRSVLRSRGKYMQEAVPVGEGAMGRPRAFRGTGRGGWRAGAALGVVSPANFNGGCQVVISGEAKAVAAACDAAKAAGAKRALPLAVSAPFHCALMRPAADRLAAGLRAIRQGPFAFPVVANVTAAPYGAGDVVADVLIRQITAPVRWEESVVAMRAAGAEAFLEVGPGKVLSGLLRRIDKGAPTAAFCGPADLDGARGLTA